MDCIYKITNKINNKVYIGRTNDFNTRVKTHISIAFRNTIKNEKYNRPLYVAIREHGLSNFNFEIIEFSENPKQVELSYINRYDSTNPEFGYNIIKGDIGDNEIKPNKKYSDYIIDCVIEDLLNTSETYEHIANKHGVSIRHVGDICVGRRCKRKHLNYPLRGYRSKEDWDNIANNVINDLLHTKDTQKQIANKYNVARSFVTMINTGNNHKREYITYPIRK